MKICSFCGIENADNTVKCSSCGGVDFQYKCNNCGSVFKEGGYCPHCGIQAGQEARLCPVCKTKYFTNACPTCGYIPGRQNTAPSAPASHVYVVPQPTSRKRKTWLWVLGWIFIFPLPLTLILLKKPSMDIKIKYGIIAGAWILYLLIGFIGGANNKKTEPSKRRSYAVQDVVFEQVTEVPTEITEIEPTDPPVENPTKAPTEAPTPIKFTSYTAYVEAGSNASVTIQGAPDTDYSIHVYYDSGESKAAGLGKKTSDSDGYATWEWEVGTNTTPGEHSITVEGGSTKETVYFTVE